MMYPVRRPAAVLAASALAAVSLLAAGCGTVTEVANNADAARNTVEVCAEAAPKIVTAMGSTATAVANYRPGSAAEVERQIAEAFATLHRELEPLVGKARDADVKAALEEVDTSANRWASQPESFIRDGVDRLSELNTALQKACGGG
jgi:hypothetical protein